jgi:hypothetical protein
MRSTLACSVAIFLALSEWRRMGGGTHESLRRLAGLAVTCSAPRPDWPRLATPALPCPSARSTKAVVSGSLFGRR